MENSKRKNIHMTIVAFFVIGLLFILISQINNRVKNDSVAQANLSAHSTAAALGYTPLAGIPGLTQNGTNKSMTDTLQFIFKWGIAVAVLLAILMTIFGGIQYMTTDSMFGKDEGKHRIQSAVMGLLLALSAWIILYTINPRILEKPTSELLK